MRVVYLLHQELTLELTREKQNNRAVIFTLCDLTLQLHPPPLGARSSRYVSACRRLHHLLLPCVWNSYGVWELKCGASRRRGGGASEAKHIKGRQIQSGNVPCRAQIGFLSSPACRPRLRVCLCFVCQQCQMGFSDSDDSDDDDDNNNTTESITGGPNVGGAATEVASANLFDSKQLLIQTRLSVTPETGRQPSTRLPVRPAGSAAGLVCFHQGPAEAL